MPTIKEMRESRAKLIADARALSTKAEGEKRALTADEATQFDKMMDDQAKLKTQIESEERTAGRSAALADAEKEIEASAGRRTSPTTPGRGAADDEERARQPIEVEVRGKKYIAQPGGAMHRRCQPRYREDFRSWIRDGAEARNLQSDLDSAGGYLVSPEQMVAELIKNVDDEVFIRKLARKFTVVDAASLGVATREAKLTTFAWAAELGAPTDDTTLAFGKRSLTPHYLTGSIRVSRDLLRSAVMPADAIVNDEFAREAGEIQEQAFISGSGANQPLGIFTAHADGIPTTRDYSTGNTTTAITFDGLIGAKMLLKQKYRNAASWMFHRDAVSQIMKIKDGTGNYIWQQSVVAAQPDRILNLPVIESEWAPNTFTTGLYVGVLGDFQWYWIVDQLLLELQRLVETRARQNQIEFIGRLKLDGAPMKAEAFTRVKLA